MCLCDHNTDDFKIILQDHVQQKESCLLPSSISLSDGVKLLPEQLVIHNSILQDTLTLLLDTEDEDVVKSHHVELYNLICSSVCWGECNPQQLKVLAKNNELVKEQCLLLHMLELMGPVDVFHGENHLVFNMSEGTLLHNCCSYSWGVPINITAPLESASFNISVHRAGI